MLLQLAERLANLLGAPLQQIFLQRVQRQRKRFLHPSPPTDRGGATGTSRKAHCARLIGPCFGPY